MTINIVKDSTAPAATTRRVTHGIEITVGEFKLNEWGLHETQAKEISELLTLNGNEPVVIDGVTFSRKQSSALSARIAAMKQSLLTK